MAKIFGVQPIINDSDLNQKDSDNQLGWSVEKLLFHFQSNRTFISQRAKANLEKMKKRES